MNIFGFFGKLGGILGKVFWFVQKAVSEEHVKIAIEAVKEAATHTDWSNDQKREWVVKLVAAETHLPESLVRFVVEVAVQAFKKKV